MGSIPCKNRRYTDHTIDTALWACRLRQVSRTHILSKKRCPLCKGWHLVRERRAVVNYKS